MKLNPRKVDKKEKMKYLDALYTAASSLSSREEMKNFLRDLLTEGERIMIGRRILVAQKLLQDKSYDEIIREMKVGKDTIMRVHRWLEDELDGYEKAVINLEKEFNNRRSVVLKKKHNEGKHSEPYSFSWLKKKYPLHFFLFNLFDELNSK